MTIRRLNRVEYRNTVRDLTGFDFKAEEEFPPDDTGYGFDTIGDVLSVSPLLLEKYMQAAESIVAAAVPTVSRLVAERTYRGTEFRNVDGPVTAIGCRFTRRLKVSRLYSADADGDYRFALDLAVDGAFTFDPGRCTVVGSSMIASCCGRRMAGKITSSIATHDRSTWPPVTIDCLLRSSL